MKNNEKSRFGGLEIREKLSLEGKLTPLLTLSWLVRAQVGAQRGKLTLLGGLRGTKLALIRALGPAKEAPRGSKKATAHIDTRTGGVMLEPWAPPKYLSTLR